MTLPPSSPDSSRKSRTGRLYQQPALGRWCLDARRITCPSWRPCSTYPRPTTESRAVEIRSGKHPNPEGGWRGSGSAAVMVRSCAGEVGSLGDQPRCSSGWVQPGNYLHPTIAKPAKSLNVSAHPSDHAEGSRGGSEAGRLVMMQPICWPIPGASHDQVGCEVREWPSALTSLRMQPRCVRPTKVSLQDERKPAPLLA